MIYLKYFPSSQKQEPKMTSAVYTWFMSEVYYWRSLASTLWSIICLPVFLFMFLVLSRFSVTHLFNWLYDILNGIVSSQFWVTLLLHGACLVMVTWFCLPHLTVIPEVESTLLLSFLALFRWSRLPLMIICSLAGTVSAWSVSRLIGDEFGSLTHVVDSNTHEQVVLNEPHVFVVLGGLFAGLSYYRQFFQHSLNYLAFPHLQRFKLFQARSEITSLFYACMWQSLHTVKYYYIVYFIFGSLPKAWINVSFNIGVDPSSTPLNSFMGLLSLSLFWQTYLCIYLLKFSWSLTRVLVKVFHTQHYEFTVQSVMEYDKQKTLSEALACSYSPLIQHLAFLDLSWVSKFSITRRQELLSLSQPGGHPRIWTSSSATALAVIRELTERVKEENWAIMSKVSVNAQRTSSHILAGESSSTLTFRGHETEPAGTQEDKVEDHLLAVVWAKLVNTLSNLPLICHLIAESPDTCSRRLFASCQLQIWAVEALSHMAAKSYTEDKYGIVQTVLPTIFASLLDLYEAIEKHCKLSSSVFKRPAGSTCTDSLLRYKLHSGNKAAIYRIVNTYRQHLEDLRLSPDYFKKLQPFVEYNV